MLMRAFLFFLLALAVGSATPQATVTTTSAANPTPNISTVSGTLPVANGGTGATTASAARTALGQATLTQPQIDYGGLNFNGTTTYLNGNALTGIADGKKGSLVVVFRYANGTGATERILHNAGSALSFFRLAGGNMRIVAENAAGTVILQQDITGGLFTSAGTYVVMLSWDLATPGSMKSYVNDVATTLTSTTFTDDTVDYTVADWGIGATNTGTNFFAGDMYLLWFDPTTAQDFSSQAVRRKFIDANLTPQFLGRNCQLPTGAAPILCLAYDPSSQWHVNRGSANSTTWTVNGAVAAPTTALSGQWVPREAMGVVKTVTADYTVVSTDKTVINNRAATNTLTLLPANACKYCTLRVVTITANTVVSASSNVVPRAGGAAGTAILAATAGAWADLESNGVNWVSTAGTP